MDSITIHFTLCIQQLGLFPFRCCIPHTIESIYIWLPIIMSYILMRAQSLHGESGYSACCLCVNPLTLYVTLSQFMRAVNIKIIKAFQKIFQMIKTSYGNDENRFYHFTIGCPASLYDSLKVAHSVSLQSAAPQPLISTWSAWHL